MKAVEYINSIGSPTTARKFTQSALPALAKTINHIATHTMAIIFHIGLTLTSATRGFFCSD